MKKCMLTFMLILTLLFCSFVLSFASSDQDVTIVNPVSNSSIASSNLLISVKITQPKTIKVSAYEIKKITDEATTALGETDMNAIIEGTYKQSDSLTYSAITVDETFSSTNNLTFYTKKLEDIKSGVYLIKVDTLVKDEVVYTSRSYITIKDKESEADNNLFDSSQSGTAAFLQNLLKSIFGNDN